MEEREISGPAPEGDAMAPARVSELLEANLSSLRAFVRLNLGQALRNRESHSDVVQSVCREILEHRERFQHSRDEGFRQWLYATTLRKVRNKLTYHRAVRRDHQRDAQIDRNSTSDEPLAQLYATLSTPSRRLMAREFAEQFEASFDGLSENHREVISLARIAGLSHQEIAERMGRSEVAVRQLLHRALTALAKELDQD